MSKLELTALNCTNCGASVTGYEGKNEVTCDYCGTLIKIIRPKEVKIRNQNLSQENQDKLNNHIEILQKAMRAGNYKEGYDYCNKALEVDPSIGALWENKAICSFWKQISLFDDDKISLTDAKEITTYLNASKENDPDSETYADAADSIGYNLGLITKLKFDVNIKPDKKEGEVPTYSEGMLKRARKYHELMELSFHIMKNKDTQFLEFVVLDLSNQNDIQWLNLDKNNAVAQEVPDAIGYDAKKKREILINVIKKHNAEYVPPKIKIAKQKGVAEMFKWILGSFAVGSIIGVAIFQGSDGVFIVGPGSAIIGFLIFQNVVKNQKHYVYFE